MTQLICAATGAVIPTGAVLHVTSGPRIGQAWRFERIVPHEVDGHRVQCTRSHPRMGRIAREFHPGIFGVRVKIEITWRRRARNTVGHACSKIDEGLIMGILALLPLAFFEHFHMAETITAWFGLGS